MKKKGKIDPEDNVSDSSKSEAASHSRRRHRSASVESRGSRSRLSMPERWSRVINLSNININDLKVYPINADLEIFPELPTGATPKKSTYS